MSAVTANPKDNLGSLSADARSSAVLESRRRRFSWATPVFAGETAVNYDNYAEVGEKVKEAQVTAANTNEKNMAASETMDKSTSGRGFGSVKLNKALRFFRGFSKNSSISKEKGNRASAIIDEKTAASLARNFEDSPRTSLDDFQNQESAKDLVDKDDRRSKGKTSPPDSPNNQQFDDTNQEYSENKASKTSGKSSSKKKSARRVETNETQSRYIVNEAGKIVPVDSISSLKGILKVTDFPINGNPVPESIKEIYNQKNIEKNKQKNNNLPRSRRSIINQNIKFDKKFRFNEFVVIFETYAMDEYDRRMGVRLEDNLSNTTNIKLELNEYKSKEMIVHPDSRKYTHFLNI